MKRQDRYPNTRWFTFYNANPRNKYTGDCVIRAISTATGLSWERVLKDLMTFGIRRGLMPDDTKVYSDYLESLGFYKCPQPRKSDNTKYTGKDFCQLLAREDKVYVAHLGGNHIVCIKDKKVLDTWDSTDGCIGNYWTKK